MEANLQQDKIYKNRWFILAIVVMQPFMACLDGSIINVALPVMAKSFNVSMASIEWVVTTYLIMISATILIFGRIADIKGKGTVFKCGLVMFAFGSLLCGFPFSLEFLVFSRVVQALGASMTMATNQGIITQVFPSNERGRALGISGVFVALGTMTGPPLGGLIISFFHWKYIFLINVPVGIITFIFSMKILPKNEFQDEKMDSKGASLFFICIVTLFLAMITGQQVGYNNIFIIISFILSLFSFIYFISVEKRSEQPMLELSIFKNKVFSINVFLAFIAYSSLSCINIIHPFYLQDVLKISPGKAGLIMITHPVVLSLVAPISGYVSDKIGSKILTLAGLFFQGAGIFLLSTLKENSDLAYIIAFIAVSALGSGLFESPNNSLVMSTVPKNKLGIAGSINALVRNLGFIFGVSCATTILYNKMSYKIGYKVLSYVPGRDDVFIYGMKWVYISASIFCFIGFTISLIDKIKINSKKSSGKVA
ncbi:multidrug resistance protein Stp [Clostridium acetireducens DSM 10703]|uniref:Multidrug resistance protein Stp n=1 Tax=Clostridium acetireducens DSM 10703 TaxID=1121290 RepID=A0A1E8EZD5_9CLOT|nr:MFS transporter [Clostridium acetireducens]OFI06060.1 multidrug resistance protein Stp [Clostridium acetireducens DSM 10703]